MKKVFLIYLLLFLIIITGCKEEDETTVINNVINQEVTIDDKINLETFEDVLCNVSEDLLDCVVGVKAKNSYSIVDSEVCGSGVVVKKQNSTYYIITNRHVVCKSESTTCDKIYIYLGNIDVTLSATLVAYDKAVDLALLKVETDILLGVAALGNSDNLKTGKFVLSIGSPYDIETYYNSVTFGNISHPKREIKEDNLSGEEVTNYYIQHDSAINTGSSGGGLFNLNGELIGINTWKITGNNNVDLMSFAVPVNLIKELFYNYLS